MFQKNMYGAQFPAHSADVRMQISVPSPFKMAAWRSGDAHVSPLFLSLTPQLNTAVFI